MIFPLAIVNFTLTFEINHLFLSFNFDYNSFSDTFYDNYVTTIRARKQKKHLRAAIKAIK